MITILEFIQKKQSETQTELNAKEFIDLIHKYKYVLVIEEYVYSKFYGEYATSAKAYYLLEAGNGVNIAAPYGQESYDDNSLTGQSIDGTWRTTGNCPTNNALLEFAQRTNIKDIDVPAKKLTDIHYAVCFDKSKYVNIQNLPDIKFYDIRK